MDRERWRRVAVAGLSIAMLASWRLGDAGRALPSSPAPAGAVVARSVPQAPSAAARREAMGAWWRAQNAVNCQREALEAWDSAALAQTNQETWRRQVMAGSRSQDLQRAAAAAARAQALARTPRERYQASELAWRIAADRGNPAAELATARLLVRLDSHNPVSRLALRHAALASGRRRPARGADAALFTAGRSRLIGG